MDEDFDFEEPHTPATLQETPGHAGMGMFPAGVHPLGSKPNPAATAPLPVSAQQQMGDSAAAGSSKPQAASPPRFSHKPYSSISPRQSPAIPVGGAAGLLGADQYVGNSRGATPPTAGTPVGSYDRRAGGPSMPPGVGSAGGSTSAPPQGHVPHALPPPSATGSSSPAARPSAQPPTTSGYKTEMCRHVQSGVPCPRGQYCHFAHYPDELRTTPVGSGPRSYNGQGPLMGGLRPRMSGASVDDGGKMGVAMSQEPPRPSWMAGGAAPPAQPPSAPIPVSPLAEVMARSQNAGSSAPRGSLGGSNGSLHRAVAASSPMTAGTAGGPTSNHTAGSAAGTSMPKFGSRR